MKKRIVRTLIYRRASKPNCLFCLTALLLTIVSCTSWRNVDPEDGGPDFELSYTIDGKEYHYRKNIVKKWEKAWDRSTWNPCDRPYYFWNESHGYRFIWQLKNPIYIQLSACNDTAFHFVTHTPYPLNDVVEFAKEASPDGWGYGQIIESDSYFMFDRCDNDGLHISFELALYQYRRAEYGDGYDDTLYVRNGHVEAHPNKNRFNWDPIALSKNIYDE